MKSFRIVNVIASTKLGARIDIASLSTSLGNVKYEPEVWCGLVWKRTEPKSTIIMFSTGKITSIGTKSEKEAIVAIEEAVREISRLPRPHYSPPTIENVVAIADLGSRMDLEFLATMLKGAIYEPDQFPSLIYRIGRIALLVFSSGKVVSAGGKSERDARKSIEDLMLMIRSYEKAK
jgi:transcription initiation factor TFIID TATA-box-binding protein